MSIQDARLASQDLLPMHKQSTCVTLFRDWTYQGLLRSMICTLHEVMK